MIVICKFQIQYLISINKSVHCYHHRHPIPSPSDMEHSQVEKALWKYELSINFLVPNIRAIDESKIGCLLANYSLLPSIGKEKCNNSSWKFTQFGNNFNYVLLSHPSSFNQYEVYFRLLLAVLLQTGAKNLSRWALQTKLLGNFLLVG